MPIQSAQTTTGLRPVVSDLSSSAKYMDWPWFEIYFGFGGFAVLVTVIWRICRPSGLRPPHGSEVVQHALWSDWPGALVLIALWPIAIPYMISSYRRSREEQRFIREDEGWTSDPK